MTNEKNFSSLVIVGISSSIFLFLCWFIYLKTPSTASHDFVEFLPAINAFLNLITTCFLILGYTSIKKANKERHIKLMCSALVTSALFLISYLTYHHFQGDSKFLGEGPIKVIYFAILITHIICSAVMLPLILGTFYHAIKKNFATHKKWARWAFPIWLYVSVTGVLIFLFLNYFNT